MAFASTDLRAVTDCASSDISTAGAGAAKAVVWHAAINGAARMIMRLSVFTLPIFLTRFLAGSHQDSCRW